MKKMIAAVLALILGLTPVTGFSQTKPDVKGFDQTIFDYHFSRADRELNPERWISEAWRGYGLAISAWELFASELYDNPLAFDVAKKQLEDWGAQELQERFFRWLCGRFFGGVMESAVQSMALSVSDVQGFFTYHLDEQGNIRFEESTGDPLVIRPGEEGRDFLQDLQQWRSSIGESALAEAAPYADELAAAYPELLAYIPGSLRESMGSKIIGAQSAVLGALRKEFEAVVAREERIFTARRTGDIWSLRKKSDDEAARAITAQLIAETEDICTRGIADLNSRIEEAQAGTGDLVLLGSEWLEMYRQQFDRGLKAWEEAEERFFIRRIEWEQDAGRLFSEGEDSWLAAFKQLEEERIKWEQKSKELFESGEAMFKKASENLEKAIAEAKVEFEYNLQIRSEAGTAKLKALVDMYLLCASTAFQSKENAQYWINLRLFPGVPEFGSQEFSDFLNDTIDNAESLNARRYECIFEIKKSTDMYYSYLEKALETRELIMREYDFIIGSGALKDILAQDATSEDFCLDEYQAALVKAKTLVKYWERQTEIARAVSEYAQESGADRMTEAEALRAWESAKAIYESAVLQYEYELNELNKIGTGIQKKSAELAKLARLMEDAEDELARINREYSAVVSITTFNMDNSMLQELNSRYSALYKEYQLLYQPSASDTYRGYIETLLEISAAGNRETALYIFDLLLNGNDEYFESLSNLQQMADSIPVFGSDDKLPENVAAYGLLPDNPLYAVLEFLVHERNLLMETLMEKNLEVEEGPDAEESLDGEEGLDLEDDRGLEDAIEHYGLLIREICALARTSAETELKIRLAGIRLFADSPDSGLRSADQYSGADWYYSARGIIPSSSEKLSLTGAKISEQLHADVEYYSTLLLEKRVDLEISALEYLLSGSKGGQADGELLSYFCLVDNAYAEDVLAALSYLKAQLLAGAGIAASDDETTNEIINWFLSGGSFFIGTEAFLAEEIAEYDFCRGLFDIYSNYGIASSFYEKEIWEDAIQGFERLFSSLGFSMNSSYLPGIQGISETILSKGNDFSLNAAQFLYDLDQLISNIPDLLYDEINRWKDALIEHIAINAVYRNMMPSSDTSRLEEEHYQLYARYEDLEEYVNSLETFDDSVIGYLNQLYWEIAHDQAILHYQYLITEYWEKAKNEVEKAKSGNAKHWREYMNSVYIKSTAVQISYAASWVEGLLLDTEEKARHYDMYVNDLLAMYSPGYGEGGGVDISLLIAKYYREEENWQKHFYKADELKAEIRQFGFNYDHLMMDPQTLKQELTRIEQAINEQKLVFETARNNYLSAANDFAEAGANYDAQYNNVKKYFNDMGEKQFTYEKQDAIRRWASTAYLETETGKVEECENKLERAKIVLEVLSNLYSGEEKRPYDNPQYAALYEEYEQSFGRMMRSLKASNYVESGIAFEQAVNEKVFRDYQNALYSFGSVPGKTDTITVKDGCLSFLRNESVNEDVLSDYFKRDKTLGNESQKVSDFEIALRGLYQRMEGYFQDAKKYEKWSLARDYLLRTVAATNSSMNYLSDYLYHASSLGSGKPIGNLQYRESPLKKKDVSDYYATVKSSLNAKQQAAWSGLSEREKADLEFYVILTLSGDMNSYYYGFSQETTRLEYEGVYNYVNDYYKHAKKQTEMWYFPITALLHIEMRDLNKIVIDRIKSPMTTTADYVKQWKNGFQTRISSLNKCASDYEASCNRLNILMGVKEDGSSVDWNEIEALLMYLGGFTDDELTALKGDWEKMLADIGGIYTSKPEAISKLYQWTISSRDKSIKALENQWLIDSRDQKIKEDRFFKTIESYISGTAGESALVNAARDAYGNNTAAWKSHFENMEKALLNDMDSITAYDKDYLSAFHALGDDCISLFTRFIGQRYKEELVSREIEWDMQRQDLKEKFLDWQQAAALILERGRQDWKAGIERMHDAYKRWNANFQDEYFEISGAWDDAYLEGLKDKEEWLAQAARVAQDASGAAFTAMLGAEAERMSRVMDTRNPLGIKGLDAVEAGNILGDLLNSPGIFNLNNAFSALNGMVALSQTTVRRGMGGGIWDAAIVKAAAADLARETNAELAAREARILAANVRSLAEDAVKSLADDVDAANGNFRRNMDEMFINEGQWTKSGKDYTKDIIVYSTLFSPVITEKKSVSGYNDFIMDQVDLGIDFDDNILANLDFNAINWLIGGIYAEIDALAGEIFGTVEEANKAATGGKNPDSRGQAPGKFGIHTGYAPLPKEDAGNYKTRKEIFHDEGEGEQGRLISDFIFWQIIDAQGIATMSVPGWDKPMWDDRDSFFDAPTIRSTVDLAVNIGLAIAVPLTGGASFLGMVALMTAVNSADDLLFSSLDVAFGYKTLGEAGFEFGKAVLMNAASSAVSGVFGGLEGVKEGFFQAGKGFTGTAVNAVDNSIAKLAVKTAMTGLQVVTTGLISSAIGGVTYNQENGWGYSKEAFEAGMNGVWKSALSSMTSTLTTGSLNLISNGLKNEKLKGFSLLNQKNVGILNSMLGDVAGQGLQYAMGNDFTLNILNTSLFSGGRVNSGLLEMHFGRDGFSMKLGSGGANVSPDTIAGSFQGALVLGTNSLIDLYTAVNPFKEKETLRAQYGFGDTPQQKQLFNILLGKDKLITGENGDYTAETTTISNKRVISLGNYQAGMSFEEQMRLAVILGHEAYRDGITTSDNNIETQQAVLAHTEMALRMLADGLNIKMDGNLYADIIAYSLDKGGILSFSDYVDKSYDSSADYWKLTETGGLEYDGFASLKDSDGNLILSYKNMTYNGKKLASDNSVEGALLYLLNIDPNDTEKVAAVRAMMEEAGLQHSFDTNPDNWMWKGNHSSIIGTEDGIPILGKVDLQAANMGKTIGMAEISKLFTDIEASGPDINKSINRIYFSAIDYLIRAAEGSNDSIASSMLGQYYDESQMKMILANMDFQKNALEKGLAINGMALGSPRRSGEFGEDTGDMKLKSSSVPGAVTFSEIHTGIDLTGNITGIVLPGGYWQLVKTDGHRAYFQLYGGDLKMRIQHLDEDDLTTKQKTIYGSTGEAVLNYPKKTNGTGTGVHIHIDMTMNLPYNGSYTRQFVDPNTLKPGDRLNYPYAYKDAAKNKILDRSGNFVRY